MNQGQGQVQAGNQPLMSGTSFIYFNKDTIDFIKMDCVAAGKALDAIDEVSDLAKPVNSEINKGRYHDDYLKTVLLSGSAKAFRDMLLAPQMAEYVRDIYKLQCESDFFDDGQRVGLKKLELEFVPGKPYLQDELNYISGLVDQYISKIEPIIVDIEPKMIVKFKDNKYPETKVPLTKSITLI